MAGLGDWMELGESGEMAAVREQEPRPSGRWLKRLHAWTEATGREPGLWKTVELDLEMSLKCPCDIHVGRLSRQLDIWAWS